MSRVCELTGKKAMVGNNVSHAMNKTKRKFGANLIKKRFYIPEEDKWVTLKVSTSALKTINKIGISAALKEQFNWLWVGFYLVRNNELVLGPFQGPVACTRINRGKGVCGTTWERGETIIVPDVEAFSGHIACSSQSRSEIVLPLYKNGEIIAVLDVDSKELDTFDLIDKENLENILKTLGGSLKK